MAITHVATVSATPGINGGATAAFDTTGANLLVVSVSWYALGGTTSVSVSDSKGNTWVPLTIHINNFRHQFWYVAAPTVGSGHTVTVTGSASYPTIIVHAVAGASSTPADQENGSAGVSPLSTGSITPTAANALIVTGIAGNMTSGLTVSPAMTQTTQYNVGGVNVAGATGYLLQTTAVAINPAWTFSGGSVESAASVASFLPAASAAVERADPFIWMPA